MNWWLVWGSGGKSGVNLAIKRERFYMARLKCSIVTPKLWGVLYRFYGMTLTSLICMANTFSIYA